MNSGLIGAFIISARFDPRLLGELLIRPLAAYEKPIHSPKIRFYLEDGNHRALVYAVFSEAASRSVSTHPGNLSAKTGLTSTRGRS